MGDEAVLLPEDEERRDGQRIYTVGGGTENVMSLRQMTAWCDARFGAHAPVPDLADRPYDIPWVAMDNADATRDFRWRVEFPMERILDEIAQHSEANPDWLERSGV